MKTLVVALLLSPMAHAQTIGVIMRVEGNVQHDGQAVRLADPISAGTKLVLAKAAKVSFLFCPESVIADAAGPGNITFAADSVAAVDVVIKRRKVAACKLPPARSASTRLGGVTLRGDNPMVLQSPVNTHVANDAATFAWAKVEGATRYRLLLKTEDQGKVTEQETTEPQWELTGVKLIPGKRYRWSATALQGDEVLSSASAWMTTLTAEEQRQLEAARADWKDSAEPARSLALAFVYEDLDMPDAALAEYRKVPAPSDEIQSRISDLELRLRLRD